MTRNEAYWKKRAAQRMFVQMQDTEKRADEIAAYYGNAAKYLSGKMDSIFERYASQYGLSETEARRLLNNLEDKDSLDELKRQLESGQSDLNRSELLRLLEAPAYRARIERFQELQRQIDVLMRNVYRQEKKLSTSHYADVIQKSYYESTFDIQQRAGFGFSVARIDQKQVDALLDSKWSGKNYSSRIWGNTQALAGELKEELMLCLITGKTEREAAERLTLRCAKGASAARRLIRTESCYVSNQMEMQSYQECGIKKYRYLATLDLRTSKICASLDGQVFLVADQQPGKNCPPMHPWCRSTTTAYVSDEELSRMKRRAYNPQTGKTELVPADMHYAEWYRTYVEGNASAELAMKKTKNESADRKQYRRYKETLGAEAPKSFEKFQDMKYTKKESWEELKEAYRDVNWQKKAQEKHSSGEGHSTPFQAEPNSVYDNYKGDVLLQRRYYGSTGKPRLDIDLTNHNNPKRHPVAPHRHDWKELQDGQVKRSEIHDMPLKLGDRIANSDILKEMKNGA